MRQHGNPRRNYAREWKRWRRERGWTQAEMASVLRLCLRTIINVEHGYHTPNMTTREKMDQLQKRYREAQ